jgi:hypothetical protein
MQVGDLIRFSSTGCQGLVTKVNTERGDEYVHVLCGPDADGDDPGGMLAFPKSYMTSIAEVINASR